MIRLPAEALIRVGTQDVVPMPGAPVLDLDPSAPEAWADLLVPWLDQHVKFGSHRLGLVVAGDASELEQRLVQSIGHHYEVAKINELTVSHQAITWANNFLRTLKSVPRFATTLDRPLAGRPAFIIGAGVSLDRVGHLLPELTGKGFTIAVNSGAKACAHYGLTPDLVMCAEAIDLAGHLDGVNTLCAVDAIAHPSNRAAAGECLTFTNHEPNFVPYLMEMGAMPLGYGAAVFNAAVSLAHLWGASPIVLIGQNLGFDDGRMYAHGSPFDDLTYEIRDGIVYTSGASKEIGPARVVWRKGWRGGPDVASNHSFETEADWLARAAARVPITNCSVGGASIPGTTELDLADQLRALPMIQQIKIEPSAPADTSRVAEQLCNQAARFLADPTDLIAHDFPLMNMYLAGVLLAQGRDDESTRKDRVMEAMASGCRSILELLS